MYTDLKLFTHIFPFFWRSKVSNSFFKYKKISPYKETTITIWFLFKIQYQSPVHEQFLIIKWCTDSEINYQSILIGAYLAFEWTSSTGMNISRPPVAWFQICACLSVFSYFYDVNLKSVFFLIFCPLLLFL